MKKQDKETISKLADVIEQNPGCNIEIDNDVWYITPVDQNEDRYLARSSDYPCQTDFYSDGHLYGAAITEALIELLRRRGLEINASAV